MPSLRTLGGILCAAVALAAGGCDSPQVNTTQDIAATVEIEGYRKLRTNQKGETTQLFFVGPPVANLANAVSARDWSPKPVPGTPPSEPPPSETTPDLDGYQDLVFSLTDVDDYRCSIALSTLLPGNEHIAVELSASEKRDVAEGRLVYVKVSCFCGSRP